MPVGGGGAWPGVAPTRQATRSTPRVTGVEAPEGRRAGLRCPWAAAGPGRAAVPVGGGGAWPDNESTRRAKLAARTARGRAAAHGHTKQPGPTAGPDGARNTSGATSNTMHAQTCGNPAPQMRDGVSPTQSGGRV